MRTIAAWFTHAATEGGRGPLVTGEAGIARELSAARSESAAAARFKGGRGWGRRRDGESLLVARTAVVESLLRTPVAAGGNGRRGHQWPRVLRWAGGSPPVSCNAVRLGDLSLPPVVASEARARPGDCAGRGACPRFVEVAMKSSVKTGAVDQPAHREARRHVHRKSRSCASITSAGHTGGFAIASCALSRNVHLFRSPFACSRSASAGLRSVVGNVFGRFSPSRMGM